MPKNKLQLLEEDIEKLFHHSSHKPDIWDNIWVIAKGLINFLILFLFFFAVVNFPAYKIQLAFFWNHTLLGEQSSTKTAKDLRLIEPITSDNSLESFKTVDAEKSAPGGQTLAEFLLQNVPNNYLVVPSIDVKAPIIWTSPPDKILEDLKKGVAHYGGTSLPNENGNVFISGHSSNYWWDDGKFKQIFALLDKVAIGDRIYLTYQNQPYAYVVEDTKVVKPDQIEVLNPKGYNMVSLMTCTPVGTTLYRRVVQAKQIYPLVQTDITRTPKVPIQLPAIR